MVIDGFIFIIFSYNVKNAKSRLLSVGVDGRRKVTLNGSERPHCLKFLLYLKTSLLDSLFRLKYHLKNSY